MRAAKGDAFGTIRVRNFGLITPNSAPPSGTNSAEQPAVTAAITTTAGNPGEDKPSNANV